MSLINKMLQDLDARGGGTKAASGDVRPVAAERTSRTAIAVGAGVGVLIVAIGAAGWYYLHRPVAAPVPAVAPAVVALPAAPAPAPAPAVAPLPVLANVPATGPETGPATVPETAAPLAAEAAAPAPLAEATPQLRAAVARPSRATRATPVADIAVPAAATPGRPGAVPAGQGAALSAAQQGENAYRRALAALQEGRVSEGIAALEQAIALFPRHEAARQTLVGLLLENGRADDAMRHAQPGLSLDPNQPQLAMLLARLQLERGGPADETLLRTLPHAAGNADYIAFLAGVLQKQGKHRQAAEQYEAALRLRPANGIWWMGLGISLQAENLRGAASDAYRQAQAAGLAPALQEFVERRLAQVNE